MNAERGTDRRLRAGFLGLGAALFGALGVCATVSPVPPVFTGTTEVVSVEVPIQVTVSGEPARGLRQEDFAVYEGRKRLKISSFEAIDLGTSESALRAVPAAARRHFLFLFDLTFSEPQAIVRARKAAQAILPSLHPSDLVAVATYRAAGGSQLVLGFTSDRQQVETALATLGFPDLLDRTVDPLRLAVGRLKRPADDPTRPPLGAAALDTGVDRELMDALKGARDESARTDRGIERARVSAFAGSLSTFARLLAEVEGRKYVVLLSQGFDETLIAGTLDTGQQEEAQRDVLEGQTWRVDSEERFGTTASGNEIERLLEELRRADCVIQSVDIGGLRAPGSQGIERQSDRDSLFLLARGTGGELFDNFNDLSGALQRLNTRTGMTYLLSVEPEPIAADGTYHRLRVELKVPLRGAQLSARRGYYAPRPYSERDPLERLVQTANMVMSGEESDDIDLSGLALAAHTAGEKDYVSLLLEIGGASLLKGSQSPNLPVEIYVYALDGTGAVHDFISETLRFDLAKAESVLRSGGLKFAAHLELLPGDFSLRVLVRNGSTGLIGLRAIPLRVPAAADAGPSLWPPLFPDPANRWLLAREEARGEMREPALPYTPSVRPELVAGVAARFVVAGYHLGRGPWKGEAEILGTDEAGHLRAVPARLQLSPPVLGAAPAAGAAEGVAAGPDRAAATLVPPDLPAGRYTLRLTLTSASGAVLTSTIPVSLRGAKRAGTSGP